MKIVVIGAGAIGSLFGGKLAKAGEEVWLLDVWEEHIKTIRKKGLTIVSPSETVVARPNATTRTDEIGKADLVMVCVKSRDTAEAGLIAEVLMGSNTLVLTLQNGIGNAEQLVEMLGRDRIVVGATMMGAIVLEPGNVMFGGLKPTYLAPWNSDEGKKCVDVVAALLKQAGFPLQINDNAYSLLWSKLALHAGINAVTAITRVTNGQLVDFDETRQLAQMAVQEVETVMKAAGIPSLYSDVFGELLAFAESMREHESSMFQDVLNKRKTEVDSINGAVVKAGKELGVPTPVNEVLTLLLKGIERTF